MKCDVIYQVPVVVSVDTLAGTVDAVRIDAERIERVTHAPVYASGTNRQASRRPRDAAIQIAEDVEWPAWDHGL